MARLSLHVINYYLPLPYKIAKGQHTLQTVSQPKQTTKSCPFPGGHTGIIVFTNKLTWLYGMSSSDVILVQ